jgi:hypothetical protein
MHEDHFRASGDLFPSASAVGAAGMWIDVRATIAAVVERQSRAVADLVSHGRG